MTTQLSFLNAPASKTPSTPQYELNADGWSVKGCSIIYAPRGQAGEYSKLATNPYRGCGHKCSYCVDGGTFVTMVGGRAKPIRDIEVGDEIVGVEIGDDTFTWCTTRVMAKVVSQKKAYKIAFSDGNTVVCSADHRWLTEDGWKYTLSSENHQRPRLAVGNMIYNYDPLPQAGSRIRSIASLGEVREMYDIMTGTENFIANGLVSHNCYVPKVLRMDRSDFDAGAEPRKDFLKQLTKDAAKYRAMGITEQVMLSFTTDPYHPFDNTLTRDVLQALQEHGMGICTLTKGGSRALRDMDLFRPDRDAFASTLTSLDDAFSRKWERGAALPGERIEALKRFHEAGIFTWVSLEPTLDTASSLSIIERTHEFVDLFKVGRANYLPMTGTTDWEDYTNRVLELVNRLNVRHYIKKDLQGFLPEGYFNPKYIPQHN